jgi:rhodanese-related sulfurtransferase
MKVLFSRPDGRILGAQIVGAEGVDKRIDLLSAAVQKGLTVYDLMELELAYAPPYSSAKDPIHIVGFIGFNVLNGTMPLAHFEDLREGDFVLDVRTDSEWRRGHVDGAVHIPLDQLRQRLAELPKDRVIYPYCGVGVRSYAAVRILLQNGFQVRNLSGGFMTWRARTSMAAKDSPANMTLKKSFLSR